MSKVRVRFYKIKNRLKEKSAGLGMVSGGEIDFDDDILNMAQAALDELAEDYPDWVSSLIDELFEVHRRCVDDEPARKNYFERIVIDTHWRDSSFRYNNFSLSDS
jgi:hypothetical protein